MVKLSKAEAIIAPAKGMCIIATNKNTCLDSLQAIWHLSPIPSLLLTLRPLSGILFHEYSIVLRSAPIFMKVSENALANK